MARPKKKTAEWYPHYSGTRNTPKMRALRHHQGNTGAIIYIFIWEYLLECDNQRTPYNEETLDVWSIDFDEDIEVIRNVVFCCLKYKMLQIDENNNIFCEDLDDKLAPLYQKRSNDRQRYFNFRNENDSSRSENDSSRNDNGGFRNENDSSRSENDSSRNDNGGFRNENGGFRSDCNNNIYNTEIEKEKITTSTFAHARANSENNPITASEGVEFLKADSDWMLQMQQKIELEPQIITEWLDKFVLDCDCRGKQLHQNLADIKQHFLNWICKQKIQRVEKKQEERFTPVKQQWLKCKEELCGAVSEDETAKSFGRLEFDSYQKYNNQLNLVIPSREIIEYIYEKHKDVFEKIMAKYYGENIRLQYYTR